MPPRARGVSTLFKTFALVLLVYGAANLALSHRRQQQAAAELPQAVVELLLVSTYAPASSSLQHGYRKVLGSMGRHQAQQIREESAQVPTSAALLMRRPQGDMQSSTGFGLSRHPTIVHAG